jgi:hypothetical protein
MYLQGVINRARASNAMQTVAGRVMSDIHTALPLMPHSSDPIRKIPLARNIASSNSG